MTTSTGVKRFIMFAFFCLLCLGIICITTTTAFAADEPGSVGDFVKFNKNMDIWFMLMLIAFLMAFIRKFEWSICLSVILSAASSCIVYLGIKQIAFGLSNEQLWTQESLIGGVVCAITVVIAIGVFLGTIKMWQYLIVGVLFAPVFHIFEYLLFSWLPKMAGGDITDPGGAILVHLFAACWGIGVALAIREKRAFDEPMQTTRHSITFAWLAAMLLFILWPSFVTALISVEDTTMVMANCYMSGFGSMITAYITCMLLNKERKINPLFYMYSLLAGPVASSSTLLLATPWVSLLIGALAGVIVVLAFAFLHDWLCNKLGVLDVMGVHNLHGIGGWISLIAGAIMAKSFVNIWAGIITLAWGIVAGIIVGLIVKVTRGEMKILFRDQEEFYGYNFDPVHEPQEGDHPIMDKEA